MACRFALLRLVFASALVVQTPAGPAVPAVPDGSPSPSVTFALCGRYVRWWKYGLAVAVLGAGGRDDRGLRKQFFFRVLRTLGHPDTDQPVDRWKHPAGRDDHALQSDAVQVPLWNRHVQPAD